MNVAEKIEAGLRNQYDEMTVQRGRKISRQDSQPGVVHGSAGRKEDAGKERDEYSKSHTCKS